VICPATVSSMKGGPPVAQHGISARCHGAGIGDLPGHGLVDEGRTAEQRAVEAREPDRCGRADAEGVLLVLREVELAEERALVARPGKQSRRGDFVG